MSIDSNTNLVDKFYEHYGKLEKPQFSYWAIGRGVSLELEAEFADRLVYDQHVQSRYSKLFGINLVENTFVEDDSVFLIQNGKYVSDFKVNLSEYTKECLKSIGAKHVN